MVCLIYLHSIDDFKFMALENTDKEIYLQLLVSF